MAWYVSGLLPNVASSLGYSSSPQYPVHVTGEGNVVTLTLSEKLTSAPEGATLHGTEAFSIALNSKYELDNPLSALEKARFRILDHISKLRNNSVTNLFIGVAIALIGVSILFSALIQISSFGDPASHSLDIAGFLTFSLAPRLSITLCVQIFSFFFLMMYRANQNEIRYFQNEITNLDAAASAVILYLQKDSPANAKIVLTSLSKTERNRILKKNEKSITDVDDAEIIRALAAVSRMREAAELGNISRTIRGNRHNGQATSG